MENNCKSLEDNFYTTVQIKEKPNNKFNLEFAFLNSNYEVNLKKYDKTVDSSSEADSTPLSSLTHHKLHISNDKEEVYYSDFNLNSEINTLMNWRQAQNESDIDTFLFEFRKCKDSLLSIFVSNEEATVNSSSENNSKIMKLMFKKSHKSLCYVCKKRSLSKKQVVSKNKSKKKRFEKYEKKEPEKIDKIENKPKVTNSSIIVDTKISNNIEKLYFDKALTFLNNNKPTEAVKLLEKVMEKGTINRDVMYYLGLGYFKLDQNERSMKICDEILKIYPKFPEVFILKGDILVCQKKFKEACLSYTDALSVDKENVDAMIGKAKSLFFTKKYDDAIHYINIALAIRPDLNHYYAVKGLCYKEKKNYDIAKECFEKYVSLGGDAPDMMEQIAKFYHEFKEYKTAIYYYDKLLSQVPTDVNAMIHKALCLGILQDKKEAIRMCEKAIKIDPSSKKAIEILHILSNE